MAVGGQIKKIILEGISFDIHGDSEGSFTPGGRYVAETETTNNGDIYLTKDITGTLTGIDMRLFTKNGTLETFDAICKKCAESEIPVSCLLELADGSKWTALGGAMVIPDGVEDGYNNVRTGATTVAIKAYNKRFKKLA